MAGRHAGRYPDLPAVGVRGPGDRLQAAGRRRVRGGRRALRLAGLVPAAAGDARRLGDGRRRAGRVPAAGGQLADGRDPAEPLPVRPLRLLRRLARGQDAAAARLRRLVLPAQPQAHRGNRDRARPRRVADDARAEPRHQQQHRDVPGGAADRDRHPQRRDGRARARLGPGHGVRQLRAGLHARQLRRGAQLRHRRDHPALQQRARDGVPRQRAAGRAGRDRGVRALRDDGRSVRHEPRRAPRHRADRGQRAMHPAALARQRDGRAAGAGAQTRRYRERGHRPDRRVPRATEQYRAARRHPGAAAVRA